MRVSSTMKCYSPPSLASFFFITLLRPSSPFSILATKDFEAQSRRLCSVGSSNDPKACHAKTTTTTTTELRSAATPHASAPIHDTTINPTSVPPLESPVIDPQVTVDTRVWKVVCPTVWEETRGVDVRLDWEKPITDTLTMAEQVAGSFVKEIVRQRGGRNSISTSQQQDMEASLATSLDAFMTFCHDHLQPTAIGGYTARIVATRGSRSSTKCPAWHQDHVPVRWIQSLVGPGCDWVESNHDAGVWTSESENDDEATISIEALNQQRVPSGTPVHQAAPGHAILLVGRLWNETCLRPDEKHLKPVVHKSPSGLQPWQGRVLLTMDVLAPQPSE